MPKQDFNTIFLWAFANLHVYCASLKTHKQVVKPFKFFHFLMGGFIQKLKLLTSNKKNQIKIIGFNFYIPKMTSVSLLSHLYLWQKCNINCYYNFIQLCFPLSLLISGNNTQSIPRGPTPFHRETFSSGLQDFPPGFYRLSLYGWNNIQCFVKI